MDGECCTQAIGPEIKRRKERKRTFSVAFSILNIQTATALQSLRPFRYRKKSTQNKIFYKIFSDEEWEKDLAAEIQDFEVVDDQNVDESELDLDLK